MNFKQINSILTFKSERVILRFVSYINNLLIVSIKLKEYIPYIFSKSVLIFLKFKIKFFKFFNKLKY
jgi:hypothetical protein